MGCTNNRPPLLFLFCAGGINDQAKGRGENSGDWPAEAGKGSGRKKRPQPKLIFHESPGQPQRRPRREKRGLWSPEREQKEKRRDEPEHPSSSLPPFPFLLIFPLPFLEGRREKGKSTNGEGGPLPASEVSPKRQKKRRRRTFHHFLSFLFSTHSHSQPR